MKFSFMDTFVLVSIILAMMGPGYIIRKKGMVKDNSSGPLAVVLIYVCQPFLTIKAFALSDITPTKDILTSMLIMFALAFVVHLVCFGFLKILFYKKQNKLQAGSFMICSLFSNASFIGIPFVDLLTHSSLALMYASVFMIAFNMLLWTLGIYLITGNKKDMKPYKVLFNPPVIALVVALPFYFFPQINIITNIEIVKQSVIMFSGMTLPLSMTIIGIKLADIPLKALFKQYVLYYVSCLKLIIIPLLTFIVLYPLSAFQVLASVDPYNLIPAITIMMMLLPTAASTVAMSEQFGGDSAAACQSFILSTILSIATVPILLTIALSILN